MRFRKNHNGDRVVDATPEETHTLRAEIVAALRRWHAREADIEDICQIVELRTWQALSDGRIKGEGFKDPVDALLSYMTMIALNALRNHHRLHSTWREVLVDDMPDIVSPRPDDRLEARDVLRRVSMRPDVARVLVVAIRGNHAERRVGLARSTFHLRVVEARKWVHRLIQEPRQPDPPTPRHRKKKR